MAADKFDMNCKNSSCLKIALHILAGFALMMLGDLTVALLFDFLFQATHLADMPRWAMVLLRSIGTIVGTYGLFFMYVKKVLKANMADFRIGKFNIQFIYIICAIALPLFVTTCFIATGGKFFYNGLHSEKISIAIIAISLALKAGIIEEMVFRGYVMKLIEAKWNRATAVLLPSFIFGLMHISSMGKIDTVGLLLLLCAGTSVGIMFSLVTYHNGSVWASSIIHMVWNTVMISNILLIYTGSTGDSASVFSIALPTNAPILTGGAFGAEASIFSIIGYSLVSLIAVCAARGKPIAR